MATDILTKVIVDCSTGETTILPLTAEEITQMEANRAQSEIDRAAQEAQADAKAIAKASANAKLAALGLTADEITAITA